ncbi:ABC transporter substrate-binding protein/permease [Actinomycetota bacterium]
MRRLLHAALAAIALLAVTLGLAAPAGAARAGDVTTAVRQDGIPETLRVGTEGVYSPFSYHDSKGKLTGYDIELMDAVAAKLGVKVEYVETPWDAMFAALEADKFDIVANQVTRNDERAAKYDLSVPYIDTTGVVVVAEGNSTIKSLTDIKGKRAAENLTSNWSDVARDAGAEVVGMEGMTESIEALRQGRVDVVINDKLAISNYLATVKNPGVKIVTETKDVSQSVYAARKGSGYMDEINRTIVELKANGTEKRIYDKYFGAASSEASRWDLIRNNAWPLLVKMVTATIPLTAITFAIGLVAALGVALARMSSNPFVSFLGRAYISAIRGIPLLVLLFLIFFGLPQFGIKLSPWTAAIIGLSANVAGYAAETIRGAILSLPRGQWEAAQTIGMGYGTSLRRIILPQAARVAVPPLSNTLLSLLKDTSLVSTILVVEMFRQAQIAAAPTFEFFTMYALAALYYWVACTILSYFQGRTETRLNRYVTA